MTSSGDKTEAPAKEGDLAINPFEGSGTQTLYMVASENGDYAVKVPKKANTQAPAPVPEKSWAFATSADSEGASYIYKPYRKAVNQK